MARSPRLTTPRRWSRWGEVAAVDAVRGGELPERAFVGVDSNNVAASPLPRHCLSRCLDIASAASSPPSSTTSVAPSPSSAAPPSPPPSPPAPVPLLLRRLLLFSLSSAAPPSPPSSLFSF
ncbi:hypothetical protein Scep_016338 [Stephania cephalantha]|uniref:Uncharacterized protein n=1 Tax=Stephania cephalantha TaxID=152367 RepID=A0AAP0INA9_9MAGN